MVGAFCKKERARERFAGEPLNDLAESGSSGVSQEEYVLISRKALVVSV